LGKSDTLKVDGVVVEILSNAMFRVKLESAEQPVIGVASGRIRQNRIMILLGDRVELELSVYDLSRGRIVRRK
jgi:translation initiation factor IF-1